MSAEPTPIEIDFKSVLGDPDGTIRTFDSYSFERNLLCPGQPFRFTAPGIDKNLRTSIRSGDLATLWGVKEGGFRQQIATGIIDETDTHVTPQRVDYVLSGRDFLGQLVDNSAVDAQNKIVNVKKISIDGILTQLIQNTRIPAGFVKQQVPNGTVLFNTNAGETKINALQRYLDLANCLIWTQPGGQLVLGKPNFSQDKAGSLYISSSDPDGNNMLEARSRRNLNQAIRQIVVQLQDLNQVDAGKYTLQNGDQDMQDVSGSMVGRSIYQPFSYGQGSDTVNLITQVGNQNGSPNAIGAAVGLREIARDNMKILDVEAVIQGHLNSNGNLFNVDQIYNVQIEDDDVDEDLYVYSCAYELTLEHGMLTRLRLCRKGTIVAYAEAISKAAA